MSRDEQESARLLGSSSHSSHRSSHPHYGTDGPHTVTFANAENSSQRQSMPVSFSQTSTKEVQTKPADSAENIPPSDNTTALGTSVVLLLLTSVLNSIYFKKMTDAMPNHPWFLGQLSTVVYIPVFFGILWFRWEDMGEAEFRFPKMRFFYMGLFDAISGVLAMIGAVHTSGSMQALLSNSIIPLTLFLSWLFLNEHYNRWQLFGSSLITLAVGLAVLPLFFGGDGGDNSENQLVFVFLTVLNNVPAALGGVYKENVFQEDAINENYLQAWTVLYQLILGVVLIPINTLSMLGPDAIRFSDIPGLAYRGFWCLLGYNVVPASHCILPHMMNAISDSNSPLNNPTLHNLPQCDVCEGAWIIVGLYFFFNMFYNYLMLMVIKYGGAALMNVVMALRLPLVQLAFALPFIMSPPDDLHLLNVIVLIMILIGLYLYNKGGGSVVASPASASVQINSLFNTMLRNEHQRLNTPLSREQYAVELRNNFLRTALPELAGQFYPNAGGPGATHAHVITGGELRRRLHQEQILQVVQFGHLVPEEFRQRDDDGDGSDDSSHQNDDVDDDDDMHNDVDSRSSVTISSKKSGLSQKYGNESDRYRWQPKPLQSHPSSSSIRRVGTDLYHSSAAAAAAVAAVPVPPPSILNDGRGYIAYPSQQQQSQQQQLGLYRASSGIPIVPVDFPVNSATSVLSQYNPDISSRYPQTTASTITPSGDPTASYVQGISPNTAQPDYFSQNNQHHHHHHHQQDSSPAESADSATIAQQFIASQDAFANAGQHISVKSSANAFFSHDRHHSSVYQSQQQQQQQHRPHNEPMSAGYNPLVPPLSFSPIATTPNRTVDNDHRHAAQTYRDYSERPMSTTIMLPNQNLASIFAPDGSHQQQPQPQQHISSSLHPSLPTEQPISQYPNHIPAAMSVSSHSTNSFSSSQRLSTTHGPTVPVSTFHLPPVENLPQLFSDVPGSYAGSVTGMSTAHGGAGGPSATGGAQSGIAPSPTISSRHATAGHHRQHITQSPFLSALPSSTSSITHMSRVPSSVMRTPRHQLAAQPTKTVTGLSSARATPLLGPSVPTVPITNLGLSQPNSILSPTAAISSDVSNAGGAATATAAGDISTSRFGGNSFHHAYRRGSVSSSITHSLHNNPTTILTAGQAANSVHGTPSKKMTSSSRYPGLVNSSSTRANGGLSSMTTSFSTNNLSQPSDLVGNGILPSSSSFHALSTDPLLDGTDTAVIQPLDTQGQPSQINLDAIPPPLSPPLVHTAASLQIDPHTTTDAQPHPPEHHLSAE